MRTARIGLLLLAVALSCPASDTRLRAAQAGPIVVLAPHPDDETLGCGGVIARRAAEGRRIVVVVVTDGRALLRRFGIDRNPTELEVSAMRKDETRRAVAILTGGKGEVRFLDVQNERLVAEQAETTRRITALLSELRPAELYVPSPFEGHAEHVATNAIARAACEASGACADVFEFIVTLKRDTDIASLPRRRVGVDVSAHRETEHRALQQFRSHLDVITPTRPTPFETDAYRRYLTDEEPFLVPR
ncbi:PIG-L deacetylase family protein [Luteitalea sp.]|jgi:LmbE family N-acetylglucosaminyl deacetylase|uniref:PIG-L deacetylase family protein n=1 Tax=Luteitalea sp. TaxID=2004800 RepID=UPI0037C6F9B1